MPLLKSKSKRAFKTNLKREISAGKPRKQALAIALLGPEEIKVKRSTKKLMVGLRKNRQGYSWPEQAKRAGRKATAAMHKTKKSRMGSSKYRKILKGELW